MTRDSRFTRTLPQLLALTLVIACGGPRIDGSTDQSCSSSIVEVSKQGLRGSDSAQYAAVMLGAIGQIAFTDFGNAFAGISSAFDDQAPSVEMPKPDSMLFQRAICDAANGMTAHEIVEQADSVMSRMKEAYRHLYAKFQIRTLQNARRQHEIVAESLAHFRVVSARLLQERGFLGLEATIVLTVQNGTAHPIRRAMFYGRVVSPGRSVPWIEGDFNYSIPGGLEPGEKTTWRLSPSMFQGRWTSVRAPSDSRMEVRTVGLVGPDGEPLWGGVTFTTGDQKLLDSLMTRFGQ